MEIKVTISLAEYNALKDHSAMLGRIASVVSRYAHTPKTTTYECVVALNERVRKLNAKVRNHKNAGGGQIPWMNVKGVARRDDGLNSTTTLSPLPLPSCSLPSSSGISSSYEN